MKKITLLLVSIMCLFAYGKTYAATDTPENYQLYKVKNIATPTVLYLTSSDNKPAMNNLSTEDEIFMFVDLGSNVLLQQFSTGKYLAQDAAKQPWDGIYVTDFSISNAKFTLEAQAGDFYYIKSVKGYLGADNDAAGSSLYMNKSTENFAKWEFEKITPTTAQEEKRQNLVDAFEDALIVAVKTEFTAAIADALTAYNKESSFGFPAEAKTTFKAARDRAEGINLDEISLVDLQTELATIKAATRAYLGSEFIPRLGAEPNEKYRIVIVKEGDSINIRYMGRHSAENEHLIPKKLDIAINPDWQLFTFEQKAGGAIDEYHIKNVYTEKYINQWGQRADAAKDANTWVAVYDRTVNGVPYFRFHVNTTTGYRWGVDSGTWPDAVNYMYHDRKNYLFTIEKNPTAFDNLQSLISDATALIPASGNPISVKSFLNNAIETAEAIEATAEEEVIAQGLLDLNTAITLFKNYDSTLLNANTILADDGQFDGFPVDAKATFTTAIEAAEGITATDAEGIQEALDVLKAAIKTYQYTELKPWIKAIDGATYHILISDGTHVRYMTVDGSNKFTPKALDTENPNSQLFYFEIKESGNLDEYYIRSAANNQYMNANGDYTQTAKDQSWAAVYSKDYAEVSYFKFWGSNMTRYWCTDNGTWPDAVSNMWFNKARIVDFTVDYVAPNTTALTAVIAEANTTLSSTQEGNTDGKYPLEARTALNDSITKASATLTSQSQVAVNSAVTMLTSALSDYATAKIVVDRSTLESKLTEANTLLSSTSAGDTDGTYTEAGRANFETAIDVAQGVFEDSDIVQADIDVAVSDLANAITAYEATKITINFEELDILVDATNAYAESVTPGDDTELDAAKITFEAAIATAEDIDRTAVNQEAVTTATSTLQTAFDDFITAVKVVLKDAIEDAEGYIAELPTLDPIEGDETLANFIEIKGRFEALIDEATILNESTSPEEITQTAVNTTVSDIKEATEATEAAYVAYLASDLSELIDEVQAFVDEATEGTEAGEYPTKSDIQSAIDAAKGFVEEADRSGDFDGEKLKLETAFTTFKESVITSIDEIANNGIAIYAYNGKLYITGLSDAITVSGYDLNGRSIFNEALSANDYVRDLAAGSYIISLQGYVNGSQLIIIK